MTTIAVRDGVVAADTRMVVGGLIVAGHATKIRRLEHEPLEGSVLRASRYDLLAVTGNIADLEAFQRWLEERAWEWHHPRGTSFLKAPDSTLVRVTTRGIRVYESEAFYDLEAPFAAFGSGRESATTAMHLGADACKAVATAMLVDPYTGGEVRSVSLAPSPSEVTVRRERSEWRND